MKKILYNSEVGLIKLLKIKIVITKILKYNFLMIIIIINYHRPKTIPLNKNYLETIARLINVHFLHLQKNTHKTPKINF